jgi:hypothetical protein
MVVVKVVPLRMAIPLQEAVLVQQTKVEDLEPQQPLVTAQVVAVL